MGYIFMTLALSASVIKGFCGKKISGIVSTLKGTFYMNALRMLLCILVGAVIVMAKDMALFAVDF